MPLRRSDGAAAWCYKDLCDRGMDEVEVGLRLAAMASLRFKGRGRASGRRADQDLARRPRLGGGPASPGPFGT